MIWGSSNLPFPGIGLLLRGLNAVFLQQPAAILTQYCGLQSHAMGNGQGLWEAFFGAMAAGFLGKMKPKPAQYTANQSNHTSFGSIPFKTARFENICKRGNVGRCQACREIARQPLGTTPISEQDITDMYCHNFLRPPRVHHAAECQQYPN
jgi:hypothetical protein